ncbi:MAG: nucleotidyltransferase domain-containing protein [Candidatus Diapherotrites archaeon]|nr:nucleotidyltransferase domain-containing protein [Candidatus Diapherotrites archaeon]
MLEKLMHSRAKVKVLGIVLLNNGLHLREIARRADVSVSEAKRELDNLLELGILKSERVGNLAVFSTNSASPFLDDLKSLYMKTEGIFAQLKSGLSNIRGIKYAFIYGSLAKGAFREKSDIDLLIIGSANENEIASACMKAQEQSGREINFILWSGNELIKKLNEKSSFVSAVIKNRKIWLLGEENGFERTAAEAFDRKS